MLLEDRVAFVTGAGSGIGRAGALAMAAEGALVVVTDRDGDKARAVADEITQAGGRAEARAVDVADDLTLTGEITGAAFRHGRLDILHSHAGIQIPGRLEEVTADQMDASWRLNVRSHFVAARAAMPVMTAQGKGSIIITSSNSGVQYDREMIAYATTKHAVIAMTKQMAGDYARHGIRVNALCPGWVDTPFNAPFIDQMGGRGAIEGYIREKVPMGRWADVEEIAEPILFLVSDRSSYMTGQILVVDGGETVT